MDDNRAADSPANMESHSCDEPLGEKKNTGFNPPYSIRVHTIRKRLGDPDGVSAKAAIDGIVKAGLLPDDSAKFIKEILFTQEKGKEEKTIITITEA